MRCPWIDWFFTALTLLVCIVGMSIFAWLLGLIGGM